MMKNMTTIAKSILILILTFGNLYAYGMGPLFDQKKIDSCKSTKKIESTVIFVSEESYVFNEDQLHSITKASSSFPNKTKEIKTNKVLFVAEGATIYNAQNIFIYKEKKTNITSAKNLAKKPHKKPVEVKKSRLNKPINVYFSGDNSQDRFILASDSGCCISTTNHSYDKHLLNERDFYINLFVFPKKILALHNNIEVFYCHIKTNNIRPPPF